MNISDSEQSFGEIPHQIEERKKAQRLLLMLGILALASYIAYRGFKEFQINRAVEIRADGKQDLKDIGYAARKYASVYDSFLHSSPETSSDGLSWQASLLPYLGYETLYYRIDATQIWNDDENILVAQTKIPEYLNVGVLPDEDNGISLSHYAANSHVVNSPTPLIEADVTDGKARTILAFEVPNNFLPWMNPENVRDPGVGIGQAPGQIGRQGNFGAHVIFLGGSVRFLSENIDPEILKALSTYNGNDRDEIDELDPDTQDILDIASDLLNEQSD